MNNKHLMTAKRFIKRTLPKSVAIAMGFASYIPDLEHALVATVGTPVESSARYCYAVWFRHLMKVHEYGLLTNPNIVVEIGPGASLGAGIAALLSGATKYYALDVVKLAGEVNEMEILDELCMLFSIGEKIPGEEEFSETMPGQRTCDFPDEILTESRLIMTLEETRIRSIRDAISSVGYAKGPFQISYIVPWFLSSLEEASADMIFSQWTLEHVEDIKGAYEAFYHWLKPGGFMSHQVDFICHELAREWNGHWMYSDFTWRLIKGRKPFLLNRQPHSSHINTMQEIGFEIIADEKLKVPCKIKRKKLARRFQGLSDDDLTTRSAYILARKKG